MTSRENTLRAVRFERPDHIPMRYHIAGACWDHYPHDALFELMESHPLLFPGYQRPAEPFVPHHPPWSRAGQRYTDGWGCVWETPMDGLTGAVIEHPLEHWDAFDAYTPPDPARHNGWEPIDWERIGQNIASAKANGRLASGGLRHGHTFLTLTYIRGYTNLILDMADDDPRFHRLLGMVEAFNAEHVRRYVGLGVEWMGYAEDLGMQQGPMLSPGQFRRYIKPVYQRLIAPAREAGCVVHMHSDGDVRALADDLIDGGVEVLNLQDLVNGIDWIAAHLKGRVCVDLDVDRQRVTRFGTPDTIDALIRLEVETLGSPDGGLMMSVIENCAFAEADKGIVISSPANWLLLRNNDIQLSDPTAPEVVDESDGKGEAQGAPDVMVVRS